MELECSRVDVVRRAAAVRAAQADDGLVLLHLDRGTYFALNATGAWIWALLDQPRPVGELCDALVVRFTVDEATAWRDVTALLGDLAGEELIRISPPESS